MKCRFPVLLYCRWINYKYLSILTPVLNKELFCYHSSDDCFAKTDYICQEESIVAQQLLIAIVYGIYLIVVFLITLRHFAWIISILTFHSVTKVFDEQLYVQFVWGDITFQVGCVQSFSDICRFYRAVLSFLPKIVEFFHSELHILVVIKQNIELILLVL